MSQPNPNSLAAIARLNPSGDTNTINLFNLRMKIASTSFPSSLRSHKKETIFFVCFKEK